MISSKTQAFRIYFLIYQDRKNKNNGMIEPTKSQEVIRDNLEIKNNWNEYEDSSQLAGKIQYKLSKQQASYVIDLLEKRKFKMAEEILTK